ncbi:MAG TPA: TIGR03435 family protein [Bryobacteraceae bacterium]|jgi:uncharacterized protein (TIGR03435 family)
MRSQIARIAITILIHGLALGQAPNQSPQFEVASVRRAAASNTGGSFRGGPGTSDPSQINYSAVSLMSMISIAYDLRPFRIAGPAWLTAEKYDVAAKIPEGATPEQFKFMLQNLLAERFHLVLHHETKGISVYALSLGKNGPKLKESAGKSTPSKDSLPASFRQFSPQTLAALIATTWMPTSTRVYMAGQDRPASWIAESLQVVLARPVVDQTGLTGKYDYYFDFARSNARPARQQPLMRATRPRASSQPFRS